MARTVKRKRKVSKKPVLLFAQGKRDTIFVGFAMAVISDPKASKRFKELVFKPRRGISEAERTFVLDPCDPDYDDTVMAFMKIAGGPWNQ